VFRGKFSACNHQRTATAGSLYVTIRMRTLLTIFSLLLFQFGFTQPEPDTNRIYPSNDMFKDSSLVSFINKLKNVALNKDTASLYKMLDEHVFCPASGDVSDFSWAYAGLTDDEDIIAFKRIWGFDTTYSISTIHYEDSYLWPLLLKFIDMGGTFDHDYHEVFTFPYTNTRKYLDTLSSYRHMRNRFVCIKNNVPVFERADTTSLITDSLSYDIVSLCDSTHDTEFWHLVFKWDWACVTTLNHKTMGWVQGKYLFYLNWWYTLQLEKKNNEWKIKYINQFLY
jgi:hypothetical protein